jgi:hypothetical protein
VRRWSQDSFPHSKAREFLIRGRVAGRSEIMPHGKLDLYEGMQSSMVTTWENTFFLIIEIFPKDIYCLSKINKKYCEKYNSV